MCNHMSHNCKLRLLIESNEQSENSVSKLRLLASVICNCVKFEHTFYYKMIEEQRLFGTN